MSTINKILDELIKKFGLNALELERLTGVPASTIYRILKDKNGNPTIEVLKKLARFFQITVSQLIGEEPIGCKQISVIPTTEVLKFLNSNYIKTENYPSISIDFPLNTKSFATYSKDNMMEPFILINSIIIIDPERDLSNKDFVLLITNNQEMPKIRQIIQDGSEFYLKVLNPNFPIGITKLRKKDYTFIGVIVHYRTSLFNFSPEPKQDVIGFPQNNLMVHK